MVWICHIKYWFEGNGLTPFYLIYSLASQTSETLWILSFLVVAYIPSSQDFLCATLISELPRDMQPPPSHPPKSSRLSEERDRCLTLLVGAKSIPGLQQSLPWGTFLLWCGRLEETEQQVKLHMMQRSPRVVAGSLGHVTKSPVADS